jgi:hypothetical protein
LISNSRVEKSPTLVAVDPTSMLAPFVLMRTCRRSGNVGVSTVRVQNDSTTPFCSVTGGVKSQLLKVDVPVPLLKFAPI